MWTYGYIINPMNLYSNKPFWSSHCACVRTAKQGAIGEFAVTFLTVMRTQLQVRNTLSRSVFVCNSMEDELMGLWKIKIMFVVNAIKFFELHYAIKVSLQNRYVFLFTANLSAEKFAIFEICILRFLLYFLNFSLRFAITQSYIDQFSKLKKPWNQ